MNNIPGDLCTAIQHKKTKPNDLFTICKIVKSDLASDKVTKLDQAEMSFMAFQI